MKTEQAISALGGVQAVAKICGISSPAVSQWKAAGIPRPWKMFLLAAFPLELGLSAPLDFKTPVDIDQYL
jgi:hypothetical protein